MEGRRGEDVCLEDSEPRFGEELGGLGWVAPGGSGRLS